MPRRVPRRVARSFLAAAGLVAVLGFGPMGIVPASPAGAAPPGPARVQIVRVKGEPIEGLFAGCTADTLTLEGKEPIPLDDIREARFVVDPPLQPFGEKSVGLRVFLRGDEMLRGTLVGADGEGLEVKPFDLPAQRVPFEAMRYVETERPGRTECDEPARNSPPRAEGDIAYSVAGDAFPGTLDVASLEGVTLDRDGSKRTVRWADLVVLHIDEPALAPPTGRIAELDTIGGSRLTATSIEGDGKRLRVTTRAGLVIDVPREAVTTIRWWGGAFTYASRLPFTSEWTDFYPSVDAKYAALKEQLYGARVDRRDSGCPLRVVGRTFRHGFAVNSKSAVTLALDGEFVSFEARFGIDDDRRDAAEGVRGDVTARVLVDGKAVWTSQGSVRGGEPARVVGPLDVSGAKQLVLEVDFGEGMNMLDRADWGDPLLVRKGK